MRRVLVARGDALGDTLLSLPAIQAIQGTWPDAEVTVMASDAARQIFAGDPSVRGVLPLSADGGDYDFGFAFTEKMWGYEALRGARTRIGFWPGVSKPFKSLSLWRRLTHKVPSAEAQRHDQGIHEVERYYQLLRAVGIEATPGPIRMAVSADDRAWGSAWVQEHGLDGYVGVHLSDKWTRNGWPRDFLQALVKRLDAVVFYGPAEAGWARDITARHHFFDPSLKRYAAVLSHARLLVSMDTSAVHLAASESIPVVDVFPNQFFEHNSTRWRPWMVGHSLVRKPDWSPGIEESFMAALLDGVEQVQKSNADQRRHPHL